MSTQQLYESYNDPKIEKMVREARKRIRKMDECDREGGFPTPSDAKLPTHLRTVIDALICGIKIKDWDTIAEGLAMLQEAELEARKKENPARL